MDPKDLITALGVLADPNASDEDKAAALDKLSAYFNSLLDTQAEQTSTDDTTAATSAAATETETTSATDADADKDKSKEMASALASAVDQIKALTERMAKMEKASAIGTAPRAKAPTVIARKEAPAPKDHVVSMIEAAERNTLRNMGK